MLSSRIDKKKFTLIEKNEYLMETKKKDGAVLWRCALPGKCYPDQIIRRQICCGCGHLHAMAYTPY